MIEILVVSDNGSRLHDWADWVRDAGHRVTTCLGPTMTPCPRFGAGPCPLREHADAAVVDLRQPGRLPHGEWGEHGCTTVPDDGSTIHVTSVGGPRGTGLNLFDPVTRAKLTRAIEIVVTRPLAARAPPDATEPRRTGAPHARRV